MLEELRKMLQDVEDARLSIVCHPDDEEQLRRAVGALPVTVIAPNVLTNQHLEPGRMLVFQNPPEFFASVG